MVFISSSVVSRCRRSWRPLRRGRASACSWSSPVVAVDGDLPVLHLVRPRCHGGSAGFGTARAARRARRTAGGTSRQGVHEPPFGSMVQRCPARTSVMMCIAFPSNRLWAIVSQTACDLTEGAEDTESVPSARRRQGLPSGSIIEPEPARMPLVVVISCSSAVGVDGRALARAHVRRRLHLRAPGGGVTRWGRGGCPRPRSRASSSSSPVLLGGGGSAVGVDAGALPGPHRAGGAHLASSGPGCAIGVDPRAFAGTDRGRRVHLTCSVSRWG